MTVFTRSEAERKMAMLLDRALREGEVRIRAEDGQEFLVKPVLRGTSPLDVGGANVGLTADEIIDAVRESRER